MKDFYALIGLARRAGVLACGMEAVRVEVKARRAALVVVALDAADRVQRVAEQSGAELRRAGVMEALGQAIGFGPVAIVAVTDAGFARRLTGIIDGIASSFGGDRTDRNRPPASLRTREAARPRQPQAHRPPATAGHRGAQSHVDAGARRDPEGHGDRQGAAQGRGTAAGSPAGERRQPERRDRADAAPAVRGEGQRAPGSRATRRPGFPIPRRKPGVTRVWRSGDAQPAGPGRPAPRPRGGDRRQQPAEAGGPGRDTATPRHSSASPGKSTTGQRDARRAQ